MSEFEIDKTIKHFTVTHCEMPDMKTEVNERTPERAIRQVILELGDIFQDLSPDQLTATLTSEKPLTSQNFKNVARHRGIPNAECGMRVSIDNKFTGTIVDSNPSANFNILFDENSGELSDKVVNVHPSDVSFIKCKT